MAIKPLRAEFHIRTHLCQTINVISTDSGFKSNWH